MNKKLTPFQTKLAFFALILMIMTLGATMIYAIDTLGFWEGIMTCILGGGAGATFAYLID